MLLCLFVQKPLTHVKHEDRGEKSDDEQVVLQRLRKQLQEAWDADNIDKVEEIQASIDVQMDQNMDKVSCL